MRTKIMIILLLAVISTAILIGAGLMKAQPEDEKEMLMAMEESVALKPGEVPGFDAKTIVHRGNLRKWNATVINLYQGLSRKGTGIPGRDPTEIVIQAHLLPDREIAHQVAISRTQSQLVYPDGAGMPQGSWTGLPIGEKSWATAPRAKEPGPGLGTASLVVWDERLALRVMVDYQPIDPKARTAVFLPVDEEDLELGELAARLILAKAHLVLIGWQELPKLRLVANGLSLEAKRAKTGTILVPTRAVIEALGGKAERKLGVLFCYWQGREVTLPIGAREILVDSWERREVGRQVVVRATKVALSLPVLFDGREVWVEGDGLAKSLGLRIEQRRNTLVLVAQ